MDLNPSGPGYKGGFNGHLRLQTLKNESSTIRFIPQDARPRFEGKDGRSESPLYRSIEAWSQFFDDIIEESTIKGERTNQLSWSFIFDQIKNIECYQNLMLRNHVSGLQRHHFNLGDH